MMDRTQCTSCDNMPWLVVNSMAPPAPQHQNGRQVSGQRVSAAGSLPKAGSSGLKSAANETGTEDIESVGELPRTQGGYNLNGMLMVAYFISLPFFL